MTVEYSSDCLPLFFNRSSSCGVYLHVQPRGCHNLHHGHHLRYLCHTLIKNKIKFFSYKEIQMGAVAKSYMWKCANI
jgi:hypothetical protein